MLYARICLFKGVYIFSVFLLYHFFISINSLSDYVVQILWLMGWNICEILLLNYFVIAGNNKKIYWNVWKGKQICSSCQCARVIDMAETLAFRISTISTVNSLLVCSLSKNRKDIHMESLH